MDKVVDLYNGSVLAEVGDFRAETVNLPQKHHRSRNVAVTTNAPILANTCYQQPFFQSNFKQLNKYKTNGKFHTSKGRIGYSSPKND